MRLFARIWVVFAGLLIAPAAAFAQASITGVVKDTSGAVLPGATLLGAMVGAIGLDALVRPRALGKPRAVAGLWLLCCMTAALFGLLLAICGNGAVALALTLAVQALLAVASNAKHAMLGEPLGRGQLVELAQGVAAKAAEHELGDERLARFQQGMTAARGAQAENVYAAELQRHGLESAEREVRWLSDLIAAERSAIPHAGPAGPARPAQQTDGN